MNTRCLDSLVILFLAAIAPEGILVFFNSAIATPGENAIILQSSTPKPSPTPSSTPPPPPSRNRRPVNTVKPPRSLDPILLACSSLQESLTALMPKEDIQQTISAYPEVLIYIPSHPQSVREAEFIINTRDEKRVALVRVRLPDSPGIISISLPKLPQNALREGRVYRWSFLVSCEEPNTGNKQTLPLNGWIERRSRTPEREQAIANGRADIWYDAIASIARQRLAAPEDATLQERWFALLQYLNEEALMQQPILGEVTVEQ